MIVLGMLFGGSMAHAYTAEAVSCVQSQLNAAGLDAGPADGLVGRKTRSALSAYQDDFGVLAERPFDSDHALIFCRFLGLANLDLKRFWPEKSGNLNVVFGRLGHSDKTADKLFVAHIRAELEQLSN